MDDLCILEEDDILYDLPQYWNSLERFVPNETANIHYTDMATQPWVEPENRNGFLWVNTLIEMIDTGIITEQRLRDEIQAGHCRPSLLSEIDKGIAEGPPTKNEIAAMRKIDQAAGFVKHKKVYEAKRKEKLAAAADLANPKKNLMKTLKSLFR